MASPVRIEAADPLGAAALALLHEAAEEARGLYPELFKADSPAPTNRPLGDGDAFVLAYLGDELAGSGSIRRFDHSSAEVRRMFVRRAARRSGVARAILTNLERVARELGYARLLLETGIKQQPAMALYESAGFARIPPFGKYAGDPTSVCFEKALPAA